MDHTQYIKDILAAISSVRDRTRRAIREGNMPEYYKLMDDLMALELCLVYQTEAAFKDAA